MMGVEIEGFDELQDELERLAEKAMGLEGTNEVSFEELFTPSFMATHTDFATFEEFMEASPWTVESQADFEAVPEQEFDVYVAENTRFQNWEAMLGKAAEQWAARQLR